MALPLPKLALTRLRPEAQLRPRAARVAPPKPAPLRLRRPPRVGQRLQMALVERAAAAALLPVVAAVELPVAVAVVAVAVAATLRRQTPLAPTRPKVHCWRLCKKRLLWDTSGRPKAPDTRCDTPIACRSRTGANG